ncbi:MAG: class I SAM-dependent DNA methyltransferase [Candidatus Hermodarchaeota archaeon]
MEQQEKLSQFIDRFYENIVSRNYDQIKTLIPLIETFEENFLSNYKRRKKEGVYYTVQSISKFIFNEVLFHFINPIINKESLNTPYIQSIDQISKLDNKIQQKILKILLNITICDPTCGSGVFLLSSIDLIFTIIKKFIPDKNQLEIKKQLVKNFYGYDINRNAIDLTILKLFRWTFDNEDANFPEILNQLKSNFQPLNSLINSNLRKFDIVIGNPPYGNILDSNEKRILKTEQVFYNDVYCSFLLKSLNWTSGIIGFLVPKSFLLRQGYIEFRNQLLSKANILKIIDIGSKLFKNATNEVQILLYENKRNPQDLKVFDFPNSHIITYNNQMVDTLRICLNYSCPLCVKTKKLYAYTFKKRCPYCGLETIALNRIRIKPNPLLFQLITNIEMKGDLNYINPINFPKMIRGEEDKGLQVIKKKLKHDNIGSCFFLNARNDFSYFYIAPNKSINLEEFNPNDLKGDDFEYYISPKLLIKHNNIVPEAIFTQKNVCFTSSIYSLLHEDLDELKYICAILNSSLMQFYCIYAINNQKNTTINLNQYMIRHLPIVKPNEFLKREIAKKIDSIINKFETDNGVINEKICKLMKEIDDSIFNLYAISEDKKKIIISDIKKHIKFFNRIYV